MPDHSLGAYHIKDLRLCVHVVVKILNLGILHVVVAARAARLFFVTQPIRSIFS